MAGCRAAASRQDSRMPLLNESLPSRRAVPRWEVITAYRSLDCSPRSRVRSRSLEPVHDHGARSPLRLRLGVPVHQQRDRRGRLVQRPLIRKRPSRVASYCRPWLMSVPPPTIREHPHPRAWLRRWHGRLRRGRLERAVERQKTICRPSGESAKDVGWSVAGVTISRRVSGGDDGGASRR